MEEKELHVRIVPMTADASGRGGGTGAGLLHHALEP